MVSINNIILKMDKTKQNKAGGLTILEELLHSAVSSSHFWN